MGNPNQCYFNDGTSGDFFQCATATEAGQSPASAAASWRRIQLPKEWRWCLTRLTHANLLELDGQMDKAMAKRQEALTTERTGLEDLIRKQAQSERWLERPSVETPMHGGRW